MGRIASEEYGPLIEKALEKYLPKGKLPQADLFEAMRYSLLAGGKRIRPYLLLEFCGVCGGDQRAALPFACAVEMIHTYSLIHDDLPCMDNDDMRRGRPSNHVVYGEAQALLAGDGLLTLAFEIMLSPDSVAAVGADRAARAAGILAKAAGAHGMVGGQAIDLKYEGKKADADTLITMDEGKTGALIRAACQMGCVLAGAEEKRLYAADGYAKAVGLSFQIMDDILDVTGDEATLGKPVGSDAGSGKSTYVSLMGLPKAEQAVRELTRAALNALSAFGEEAAGLEKLAVKLASRKS